MQLSAGYWWVGFVRTVCQGRCSRQVTRDVETCDLGPRVQRRSRGASTRARRVQEEEAAGGPADVTPGVQPVGQRGRGLVGGAGSAASESASVYGESAPTAHRQQIRHGSAGPRDPHRTSTGLEPGGRGWSGAEGPTGDGGQSRVSGGPEEPKPGLNWGPRVEGRCADLFCPTGRPLHAGPRQEASPRGKERSCLSIPTYRPLGGASRPLFWGERGERVSFPFRRADWLFRLREKGAGQGRADTPARSPEKADGPFTAVRLVYTFLSPYLSTPGTRNANVPALGVGAEVGGAGGQLRRFALWAPGDKSGASTQVHSKPMPRG